jgi:hypothetical protein
LFFDKYDGACAYIMWSQFKSHHSPQHIKGGFCTTCKYLTDIHHIFIDQISKIFKLKKCLNLLQTLIFFGGGGIFYFSRENNNAQVQA